MPCLDITTAALTAAPQPAVGLSESASAWQGSCQSSHLLLHPAEQCLNISHSFAAHAAVDHRLQDIVGSVIQLDPHLGGDLLTAGAVDRSLLLMLLSIDQLLPSRHSTRVNFKIQRDQADSDSQMTLRSPTGSSLRSDLQLRAEDAIQLLFKGEEKGLGRSLAEAYQVCIDYWQLILWDQLFVTRLQGMCCCHVKY